VEVDPGVVETQYVASPAKIVRDRVILNHVLSFTQDRFRIHPKRFTQRRRDAKVLEKQVVVDIMPCHVYLCDNTGLAVGDVILSLIQDPPEEVHAKTPRCQEAKVEELLAGWAVAIFDSCATASS